MNVCGLARHCCDLLVAVGIGDTAVAACPVLFAILPSTL